jgi:hypothetical protein
MPEPRTPRKPRKSPKGPGFTIRQFAEAVNESPHVIRRAVADGTVDSVDFNGIKRIPPREKVRWIELWGEPQETAA